MSSSVQAVDRVKTTLSANLDAPRERIIEFKEDPMSAVAEMLKSVQLHPLARKEMVVIWIFSIKMSTEVTREA
jgi:hypothetical protein